MIYKYYDYLLYAYTMINIFLNFSVKQLLSYNTRYSMKLLAS